MAIFKVGEKATETWHEVPIEDPTLYLPRDGSGAMTGDLPMGGNAIVSVGNVDGRDVSADGTVLDTAILDGDFTGNGLMVRGGPGLYTNRSIAVADAKLTIANGDGFAGDPTLGFGSVALADLSDGGTAVTAAAVIADNALVRGDGGVRGTQGSPVIVTDVGAMSGLTQLTVDQLILNGNAISGAAGTNRIMLVPTGGAAVDIEFDGNPTQNRDFLRIIDTNWNASMIDTRSSIAFRHSYDASSSDESGRITVGTETNWGAAGTRDAYMAFQTTLAGVTSEKSRISSAGAVGINTTDPGSNISTNLLDIRRNQERCTMGMFTAHNTLASKGSSYYGGRSRGTITTPTIVQDDDTLFAFVALGYDGGVWRAAAQIIFTVDGAPASGAVPTQIAFRTGATAATIADRFIMQSDGDILIDSGTSMFVRDSALGFNSSVDGQLDLFGDTEVEITTPLIDLNAASIFASTMASGTDQTDAGAAAGELYVDTNDDNTVKRGV